MTSTSNISNVPSGALPLIAERNEKSLNGKELPSDDSEEEKIYLSPTEDNQSSFQFQSYGSNLKRRSLSADQLMIPKSYTANHSFDLCASLYKRRGGFGRNRDNNWVRRVFSLNDSVLCYYDDCDIRKVDPSKPRNRLNLIKEDTLAEKYTMQKADAPTVFLIVLRIFVLGGKKKWEICCDDQIQQHQWLNALKSFDGKPLEPKGVKGSLRNKEGTKSSPFTNKRKHRGTLNMDNASLQAAPKGSPSRPYYGSDSDDLSEDNGNRILHKFDVQSRTMGTEVPDNAQPNISVSIDWKIFASFATFNVSAFFMRVGSVQSFWMAIVISNFAMYYLASKVSQVSPESSTSISSGALKKAPPSSKKKAQRGILKKNKLKMSKAGNTIPRGSVKTDSALAKTIEEHGPDSMHTARAYASAGPDQYNDTDSHCYWNSTSSDIKLRVGPNYKKNRQKAPSAPALYDLHSMDVIRLDSVLEHASDAFQIPDIPGITDIDTGHPYVPPMIVINVLVPADEPSLFQKTFDGPTYAFVTYAIITENTLRELKDFKNASPAVKLFAEWCEKGESNFEFRSRFKFIGMVEEIEKTSIPSFLARHNGKPALVTKSGTFTRYSNYIEMSVNIRYWAFIANKGIHALLPKVKDVVLNIGATIEGRKDDELPEILIGACRVMRLDLSKIMTNHTIV